MECSIEKYQPIDCRTWDYSGNGNNIMSFLESSDKTLWKLFHIARPTNDVRGDPGHMENVVRFCFCLSQLVGGDLHLTIPFGEFHDSSWNITPDKYREMILSGVAENPKYRFSHQANGALRALEAFQQVGYPEKFWLPVFSYINDHDTRFREPKDINEMISRDADILWRFTEPSRRIYHKDLSPEEFILKLEHDELERKDSSGKLNRFYLPISWRIARLEMVNAAMQIDCDEAILKLREKYPYEVERLLNGAIKK